MTNPVVAVTGATGLLGRAVVKHLQEMGGVEVLALGYHRAKPPSLKQLCIAPLKPDVVEKSYDEAYKLNVKAVESLASVCVQLGVVFVLVSTDYVFDGTRPPYRPTDQPNPLNNYGKSKYEGEQVAIRTNPQTIILRIWSDRVCGRECSDCPNPRCQGISQCCCPSVNCVQQGNLMDHVAIRYPTHTADVARIERSMSDAGVCGKIYHFTGDTAYTKYEMALIIADELQISRDRVQAQTQASKSGGANRPLNAHLSVAALEAVGVEVSSRDFTTEIRSIIRSL